jgi:hypothetical protein
MKWMSVRAIISVVELAKIKKNTPYGRLQVNYSNFLNRSIIVSAAPAVVVYRL